MNVEFTICDGCTECYWYEKDCQGKEQICEDFIFNEETWYKLCEGCKYMSNFEYPNADCENCLCGECNENIDNGGGCSGCATCNGISKSICPTNKYHDDYGNGQGN